MNSDSHLFTKLNPGLQPSPETPQGEFINQLTDRALADGPLKVLSIETPALLAKSAEAGRLPSESLMAWCGRIGINPRQLKEWPAEKVSAFSALAEKNALDMEREPQIMF